MNQYVNTKEPWKLKEDPVALKQVVYNCVYSIQVLAHLMSAFMPQVAIDSLKPLGIELLPRLNDLNDLKFGATNYNSSEPTPLFPKIEIPKA